MSEKLTTSRVRKVHVAEVVRHGEAFVVPEGLSLDSAIEQLQRLKRLEEEVYSFNHTFEAFIWDGAVALSKAITNIFGFGFGEATRSFFGSQPPELVEVRTGPNPQDKVLVPWGRMSLPNIEGEVYTGGGVENGKFIFKLVANVKRKHEKQIKALADEVQRLLNTESIYRGKAFKLKFKSGRQDPFTGETIPNTPEFLRLGALNESDLIFDRDLENTISTHLFTPIDRIEDLRVLGMSGKRGVLLAGTYGTGKTLAASVAANKAMAAGITFLLVENAEEFAQAVEFAKMYGPAVVFCEDIDRVLKGERSINMDQILNIVDGVESKRTEVMVVLTTNDVDAIHPAALRPGRLDKVINVHPPQTAEAVSRLIRLYARGAVPETVDITAAAQELTGNIPAIIAEAVNAAKLSQLKLNAPGDTNLTITPEAMLEAAKDMKQQIELLNRERKVAPTQLEKAANIIGQNLASGLKAAITNAEAVVGQEAVKQLARGNGKLYAPTNSVV